MMKIFLFCFFCNCAYWHYYKKEVKEKMVKSEMVG